MIQARTASFNRLINLTISKTLKEWKEKKVFQKTKQPRQIAVNILKKFQGKMLQIENSIQ